MRKMFFVLALIFSSTTFGQFSSQFQNAYATYPSIPKGVLEAVAWNNTHMRHLATDEQLSCSGLPQAKGVMGLFDNGQNYFRENAVLVSQMAAVPLQDVVQNSSLQIMAYASAFNGIYTGYLATSNPQVSLYKTLYDLSEIPTDGMVNQYALDAQIHQVLKRMTDSVFAQTHAFQPMNINFSALFGQENLQLLESQKVIIDTNGIHSNTGAYFSISQLKSTEYGPAIWNPAPSCNFSSRSGTAVSAITIHTIQGSYSSAISWSQNCASNVSFHYVIRSSDGQVTQMVLEQNKAWHVGSENPYTIGYEHEGYVNDASWYTEAMYQSSAALSRDVCGSGYGISPLRTFYGAATTGINTLGACTRIKGHQHYPNQSHTDPGINWNWEKYYKLINNTPVITTVTASSGSLFDSGGPSANYSNDERLLWRIQPPNATSISLSVASFSTEEDWDKLFVYDGADLNSPLIGVYHGTTIPTTIVSSGGALLLEFRSDCAITDLGWQINYSSVVDVPVYPTTSIVANNQWISQDVTISFTDQTNNTAISNRFYLVEQIDTISLDWKAKTQDGMMNERFNNLNQFTQQTGVFAIVSNELVNEDENLDNTNLYKSLHQDNSSEILYHWNQMFYGAGANQRAGLHFMCSNAALPNRGNSYFVYLREGNDKVQIYKVTNDVYSLMTNDNFVIDNNIWYDVKVVYNPQSGLIQAYVNDVLASTWTDTSPLTTGNSVSLRTGNSKVKFDELKVYKGRTQSVVLEVGPTKILNMQSVQGNLNTCVHSLVKDNLYWSNSDSTLFKVDYTAPLISYVYDGFNSDIDSFYGINILANWSTNDAHSAITQVEYCITTDTLDLNNVTWNVVSGNSLQFPYQNVIPNTTYYIGVKSTNESGLSRIRFSDGQQNLEELGLSDNFKEFVHSIFPVPVVDYVNIVISCDVANFEMISLNGQVVSEGKLMQGQTKISMHGLPAGIYLLKIINNGNVISKKIEKVD